MTYNFVRSAIFDAIRSKREQFDLNPAEFRAVVGIEGPKLNLDLKTLMKLASAGVIEIELDSEGGRFGPGDNSKFRRCIRQAEEAGRITRLQDKLCQD